MKFKKKHVFTISNPLCLTVVQTQWCRRACFKEPIYTMWQYESREWQKIKSKTCWLLKYLLILTFVSLEWKCDILLLYIWIIDKFTLQKIKKNFTWWKCSSKTMAGITRTQEVFFLFHFLKLYSFPMNSVVYVFPKMDSFGEDLQNFKFAPFQSTRTTCVKCTINFKNTMHWIGGINKSMYHLHFYESIYLIYF